jgi:hypothetical protein
MPVACPGNAWNSPRYRALRRLALSFCAVTVQGIYSAIANAIQLIHTKRFLPPEVIVMHPRPLGMAAVPA